MSQADVTSAERASYSNPRGAVPTPLASTGIFDDETTAAKASIPAPPSSRGFDTFARPSVPSVVPAEVHAAPSMPVPAASPASAVPQASAKSEKSEKKGGAVYFLGGLGGLAAVAAAAFFVVRGMQPGAQAAAKSEPIVVSQAIAQPAAQTAPAATTAPAAAADQPVQAAAPIAQADLGVDPMSLPQTGAPSAIKGSAPAPAKGAAPAAPAVAAKSSAPVKGAKPESKPEADDQKLVAKDLPASPATTGALGDAMKQAAGPVGNAEPAQAAANPGAINAPGSVSQIPGAGAIKGAIGAALPAARACLGPDDPVSRAQIVFESSGAVSAVNVSGSAAGKPAEACIKAALGKAKVPPFAQSTYAATVTVRP